VNHDDAIKHAEHQLKKKRGKGWDWDWKRMGNEDRDWAGMVRLECPVKDDERQKCHVLVRLYMVSEWHEAHVEGKYAPLTGFAEKTD